MSKLRDTLLNEVTGYTKSPAQYKKIVALANSLFKELKAFPKFGSDDKIFEIKAKRLEDQCTKLTRAMTEDGKVGKA